MKSTRLAAVVFAEIDGFTELTSANERLAIELLGDYASIALPLIPEHGGKVFDSVADQLLVVFDSALSAVQCALQLHLVFKARNATVTPDRAIWLRVGIHLGEIWMDETRVYGNGVNIAARVLNEAEAGSLLLSDDVYNQVSNKLEAEFEHLESRILKNIERPIGLWRIVTGCERKTALFAAPAASDDGVVVSRVFSGGQGAGAYPGQSVSAARDPVATPLPGDPARETSAVLPATVPSAAVATAAGVDPVDAGFKLEPKARDAIDRFVEELRSRDDGELEEYARGGELSPAPAARAPAAPRVPASRKEPGINLTINFGAKEVGDLVSSLLSDGRGGAGLNDVLKQAADSLDDDPERQARFGRKMRALESKLSKLERAGVFSELGKLGDLERLGALGNLGDLADPEVRRKFERDMEKIGRDAEIAGQVASDQARALRDEGRRLARDGRRLAREGAEEALEARIEAKLEARLGRDSGDDERGDEERGDSGAVTPFSPDSVARRTESEWKKMERDAQKNVAGGASDIAKGLVLGGLCAAGYFFLGASMWWLAGAGLIGVLPFLSGVSKLIRGGMVLKGARRYSRKN